jgi:CDGSH-type Zn-finger protein
VSSLLRKAGRDAAQAASGVPLLLTETRREKADMSVTITIKENGPLLVDGDFTLVDSKGNQVPVMKRALCRCGGSTIKPFCDGTHSKIGFQGAAAAVASSENKPPST